MKKRVPAILLATVMLLATCLPTAYAQRPSGFIKTMERIFTQGDNFGYKDGPAGEASLSKPWAMAAIGETLYIADGPNIRAFRNGELTTIASLWDDMDILAPYELDNDVSIDSIIVDCMIPDGDDLIVGGRMFREEYIDISKKHPNYEFGAQYDPKKPFWVVFGFGYSFVFRVHDGHFKPIAVEFSGTYFWSEGSYSYKGNKIVPPWSPTNSDSESRVWYEFVPRVWLARAQDGTIYALYAKKPIPMPPKEQRTSHSTTVYNLVIKNTRSTIWKITNDIPQPIYDWELEMCGYYRKYYPEDPQFRFIALIDNDRYLYVYDGGYYGYLLDLQNPSAGFIRYNSMQTPSREYTTIDETDNLLCPVSIQPSIGFSIGNDLFMAGVKGLYRFMDGYRVEAVAEMSYFIYQDPETKKVNQLRPGSLAIQKRGQEIEYYFIDLNTLDIYRMVQTPYSETKGFTCYYMDYDIEIPQKDKDKVNIAVEKDGKLYIPIEPFTFALNCNISVKPDGTIYAVTYNGKRVKYTGPFTRNEYGYVCMPKENAEEFLSKISVKPLTVQVDEYTNSIYVNYRY